MCFQVSFTENTESVDVPPGSKSWIVTSFENTWTHQRRKRRLLAREQPRSIEQGPENQQKDTCEKYANEADCDLATKRLKKDGSSGSVNQDSSVAEVCSPLRTDANLTGSAITQKGDSTSNAKKNCCSIEESNISSTRKDSLLSCSTKPTSQIIGGKAVSVDRNETATSREVEPEGKACDQALPLLKCLLTVLPGADLGIAIHLDWISGQNRECMHQLMLYFKNKLQ